jgi:hypothetical protein
VRWAGVFVQGVVSRRCYCAGVFVEWVHGCVGEDCRRVWVGLLEWRAALVVR